MQVTKLSSHTIAFNSNPSDGKVNEATSNLSQLEQNLNLEPVIQAMKLLKLSIPIGYLTTNLDTNFINSISSRGFLLFAFGLD